MPAFNVPSDRVILLSAGSYLPWVGGTFLKYVRKRTFFRARSYFPRILCTHHREEGQIAPDLNIRSCLPWVKWHLLRDGDLIAPAPDTTSYLPRVPGRTSLKDQLPPYVPSSSSPERIFPKWQTISMSNWRDGRPSKWAPQQRTRDDSVGNLE